ncbi:MAG: Cytochrome [Actinomycetia bacterium]|nr:Cytochrome [Actinomycetes bacterium]
MNLDDIDLLASTWGREEPHEMFALLRRDAPVFRHREPDGDSFWAITKHADVLAISRDSDTFSSELGGTFIDTQTDEMLAKSRLSILNMDPPKHHQLRRLVSKGFTPRMITRLQDTIDKRAQRIIDDVIDRGECEFVEDIAAKLPLEMICEMIGLPEADWPRMFELSNKLIGFDDPEYQASPEEGELAAIEIFTYCDRIANDRRSDPRDDIMSALVHAEVDGERLDDLELNLFFVTLVVAGNETTRNLINHSMLALMQHPEEVAKLRAEPEHWTTAVEEMLRWGTSIHNFRRTATRDTELRGQRIAAGDKVVMYYMSANRDEDVFVDPMRFDVTRQPNDHVTFGGGGVHYCLGANLARSEIKAVMQQIVQRFDDVRPAGAPRRLHSDFVNGIKAMPISFDARPAERA